jgi:hypothetical protein
VWRCFSPPAGADSDLRCGISHHLCCGMLQQLRHASPALRHLASPVLRHHVGYLQIA